MPKRTKRSPEEERIGRREAVKRYAQRHPERVKARIAAWRQNNKEYTAAYDKTRRSTEEFKEKSKIFEKERYAKDPEFHKGRSAKWRKDNAATIKDHWKKHRQKNKEQRAAQSKKWRIEHREHYKAMQKAWAQANREKVRLYGHGRRVRMRNSGGKITVAQINELWKKQGGKCAYFAVCGNLLTDDRQYGAQLDHIDSLKPADANRAPGRHEIDNAQLLCGLCNRKKKNHDPYKFAQEYAGTLFPDLPKKQAKK
jgi:5-methylcytosine-specific restriction endonuclease McrA